MIICRRFECILEVSKSDVVEAYKNGITNEIKLKYKSKLPIYNTCEYTFETLLNDPGKIKENFKLYLTPFNPLCVSIFTKLDFM